MKLGHMQMQALRWRLGHAQKQSLRNLLAFRAELKDPQIPSPLQGLEGMLEADKILKERDSRGFLIGGMADALCNSRRKPEDLMTHKDVDVMVLDDQFELSKSFEGGIDWWLPYRATLDIVEDNASMSNLPVRYWENGNGIKLVYGARADPVLNPGLHVLGPELVIEMRNSEIHGLVASRNLESTMDRDIWSSYERHLKKTIKNTLPKFIASSLPVLGPRYFEGKRHMLYSISFYGHDKEVIRALSP